MQTPPNPFNSLLFWAVRIVLAPITIAGSVLYVGKALAWARRTGVSFTAYEPLLIRWLYHETGVRPDAAGKDILFALPGTSRLGVLFQNSVQTKRLKYQRLS